MTDLHMNYFVWGAAHYKQREFLSQVITHASVMGHKIQMQSYMKSLLSLYYLKETEIDSEEKQTLILYLYTLWANEGSSDF